LIALFALFGFNFFARLQSQTLDHLERLGSKLIDHIRLDEEKGERETVASVTPLPSREGRAKR
jgi:biopolymer transport protein ExbB